VFDTSNKSGLIVNIHNLDLCCGDGAVVKFHSAFRLYVFTKTLRRENWILNLTARY
jgi:hypothetical protein